jgi:predicted glutamine amidotransferase
MCRLLGVVAATPAPLAELLVAELEPFVALSEEHDHGWGIGHRGPDGAIAIRKDPVRAADSETFHASVAGTASDVALLHIRQASPGMPLTPANTHPFLAGGIAFAHNGYAWPNTVLDTLIEERGAPAPKGDTDSERYCSLVRAGLREGSVAEALGRAAALITERATMTSLNSLLVTPDALYAVAWWHAPTIRAQPDGETERDYRLWYRVAADRVVVASAGMQGQGEGWQELPDRCVLEIARGSLHTTVYWPD